MRIALVNYVHSPHLVSPESLIDAYETVTGLTTGLAKLGVQARVFQGFTSEASIERPEATWEFVGSRNSARVSSISLRRAVNRRVADWTPDVAHVHSLLFTLAAADLRRRLPRRSALLIQHHAEPPPRSLLKRWAFRAALGRVDGFSFSGMGLCREWLDAGLIRPTQAVFEIMEGSTAFCAGDRGESRRVSGLSGEPCVLWVGRLDRNKDPLTVLAGFEQVLKEWPQAKLYMVYAGGDLEGVKAFITRHAGLDARVTLLGLRAHDWLEDAFRAADVFVLGSHREGSGYAATEAIACGAVPVITDIPAFRFLTAGGAFGALWTPGDSSSFARALLGILKEPLAAHRERGRAYFDAKLSFAAIARDALRAYADCFDRREPSP